MMSQCDCKDGALTVKENYPVEIALEKQLSRSLIERVRESFRVDIQMVAEQAGKQSIRPEVADRWLTMLTYFIDLLFSGETHDSELADIEKSLFSSIGLKSPSDGGTPFAISNSKGS